MRYFLRLAYNGTDFHGWQRQPNAVSVQESIEKTISTILQSDISITGAGRTDTGVHASEMYAHFDTDKMPDKARFILSANRMLGAKIAIYDVIPVKPEAHARFDAKERTYRYYISLRKDPFLYPLTHFVPRIPDVELMNEACKEIRKVSDFTSFAKLHTDTKTNICKVNKAFWEFKTPELLVFTISADRFLRNMVRAVTGTLLDVGNGKLTIEGLKSIIDSKDRCEAGQSMPACGLFLEKIVYPEEIFKT